MRTRRSRNSGEFNHSGVAVTCFTAQRAGEQPAPDEVRFRKPIHEITNRLLIRAGTAQLPEIRRLTAQCGLHA